MKGFLKLERVSKRFQIGDEQIIALQDVSLEVCSGDYIALTGMSGSGKSTLMNIIGFLDMPTSGRYFFRGIETGVLNERELALVRAKEIGFVFQSFNLLPRISALQNVMRPLTYQEVPREKREGIALEALDKVGLSHRQHHLPNQLSGGQRQRVAIARAICARPSLIIADEPTGNLDTSTSQEILAIFDELHTNGATIVLVTHESSIAQRCKRVVSISDGRIIRDERR